MDRAYLLQHERVGCDDAKVIGIYSSEADAQAAIERLRKQPGFCDHPDCFFIDEYELGKDHWVDGFVDL